MLLSPYLTLQVMSLRKFNLRLLLELPALEELLVKRKIQRKLLPRLPQPPKEKEDNLPLKPLLPNTRATFPPLLVELRMLSFALTTASRLSPLRA